jgi:hypothetical protein
MRAMRWFTLEVIKIQGRVYVDEGNGERGYCTKDREKSLVGDGIVVNQQVINFV